MFQQKRCRKTVSSCTNWGIYLKQYPIRISCIMYLLIMTNADKTVHSVWHFITSPWLVWLEVWICSHVFSDMGESIKPQDSPASIAISQSYKLWVVVSRESLDEILIPVTHTKYRLLGLQQISIKIVKKHFHDFHHLSLVVFFAELIHNYSSQQWSYQTCGTPIRATLWLYLL